MKGAAALAAALVLVAEVVLRVAGYSAPAWYELDPDLGWRLKPHRHGWFAGENGAVAVSTNPAGFRDREHFLDKREGIYRVAVLGDEFSEAMQVPVGRTWWAQLRAPLARCAAGKKVEVLDFGVAGYGTAQEYVLLQTSAMRYQPDLVLLQFSNRDDLVDNAFALTPRRQRPFYRLDARGGVRIDASFAFSPDFDRRMQTRYRLGAEIADHSRAFQLARQLARATFFGEAHARTDLAVLEPPRNAEWRDAWRITEGILREMNAYTRRNGAALVVVAAPDPRQAMQGMAYPDERLESLGRTDGIAVITLADAMKGAGLYLRSGEWSVEGHRRAAGLVAAGVCPLIATARPG